MPARTRTAQQLDARELALTRPADPYRGALSDPYVRKPVVPPVAPVTEAPRTTLPVDLPRFKRGTPVPATLAGILGITLGVTVGLFGLLLLTYVSLQDEVAPDRSFYQGTDSGYVVLALVNFGIATGCGLGGIVMMTGRLTGRIAMTAAGWTALMLSAFWYLRGQVNVSVSLIIAVAAALMLALAYQRSVTRWLGVLPAVQPE
jgi:hypothetical protein